MERIQEWRYHCIHWWRIQSDKTNALVFSRSRMWTLHMVTRSCLGFPFTLVPTSTSMGWSLTACSPSMTMYVILFLVSLRELVFRGWWSMPLWTPPCNFIAIMHLFPQCLSIVLLCRGQLQNVKFSPSSTRYIQWPGFALIKVSWCCVINVMFLDCVCCTRLIQTRITVCSNYHPLSTTITSWKTA